MSLIGILGLAAAMFVLAITPGPGVFATVSTALTAGLRPAVPVIIGIVAGDLIFLLLAIFGLSAIAESFGTLFQLIKFLGGAYLIWLGLKFWRSNPEGNEINANTSRSDRFGFLGGFSITLGNPKVILFYLGFLPTFVDLQQLSSVEFAIVASVISFVLATVLLVYAFTAARARLFLAREASRKKLNRIAGSVMIGTGAVLIAKTG